MRARRAVVAELLVMLLFCTATTTLTDPTHVVPPLSCHGLDVMAFRFFPTSHYSINETYMWHGSAFRTDGILSTGSKSNTRPRRVDVQLWYRYYFAVHAELSLQRDYAKAEHYKDKNNKEYHRKCLFTAVS